MDSEGVSEGPAIKYYDYKIDLGQGAFGSVHKYCLKTNASKEREGYPREMAVKKLLVRMEGNYNYRRETEMCRLRHKNIVLFFGAEHKEGTIHIKMELANCNLKKFQADFIDGSCSNDFFLHMAVHICEGLDYLHNQNIAHRDIKPQNILVLFSEYIREGNRRLTGVTLKLCDFGLSRNVPEYIITMTAVGTVKYSAPEVRHAINQNSLFKGDYKKVDIYSCGIVFMELLLNRLPDIDTYTESIITQMLILEQYDSSRWRFVALLSLMLRNDSTERINTKGVLALIIPWYIVAIEHKANMDNWTHEEMKAAPDHLQGQADRQSLNNSAQQSNNNTPDRNQLRPNQAQQHPPTVQIDNVERPSLRRKKIIPDHPPPIPRRVASLGESLRVNHNEQDARQAMNAVVAELAHLQIYNDRKQSQQPPFNQGQEKQPPRRQTQLVQSPSSSQERENSNRQDMLNGSEEVLNGAEPHAEREHDGLRPQQAIPVARPHNAPIQSQPTRREETDTIHTEEKHAEHNAGTACSRFGYRLLDAIAAILCCRQLAIHVAAGCGCLDTVGSLVDYGYDIDIRNGIGHTMLHGACINDELEMVYWMLAKGADVNARNDEGLTPLNWALEFNHWKIATVLLENGADIKLCSQHGIAKGLNKAITCGNVSVAKHLLERGANANAVGTGLWKSPPLHQALLHGHLEVAELLIAKGARCNKVDDRGWTALHCAAEEGHWQVSRLLLESGANIEAANKKGRTPLHYACKQCHVVVAQLLIARGASINAIDEKGDTPLHLAFSWGRLEIVKLLLESGAQGNPKNKQGKTPLQKAGKNMLNDFWEWFSMQHPHLIIRNNRYIVSNANVNASSSIA